MFDWDELSKVHLDDLLQDSSNMESRLEELYSKIAKESIDLSDEKSTPDNLIHLIRICQVVMQSNRNHLVDAQNDLKIKEKKLNDQEIELRRIRASTDPASNDVTLLKEELIKWELKFETVVREREGVEEILEQERMNISILHEAAAEDREKIKSMEEEKKKLQSELREAKLKISSERWKLQSRSTDDEAHKATISKKNAEIAAYIEDIQRLSTENKGLMTELEEIQAEQEAAMGQLESYEEELETLRSIAAHSEDKISGLVEERDQLRIKLEDLSFQIDGKQDIHDKHIQEMEKKINKLKSKTEKIEAEKQEQIAYINTLNETIHRLRRDDNDDITEELRKELNSKDATIKELKVDLANAVKDFEILAKDWHRFDTSLANKQNADSPKTETDALMTKEKLSMFKARRKEDTERIQRLIEQIAEREAKIIELEETVMKYEDGSFGLKEAVAEIKFLKGKIVKTEAKINSLTDKINDLESQGADLAEDNFALREKLGLPASELDLTNFKQVKAVELEQAKALNFTLQGEIDKLEEERLELKAKMRFQAINHGERAIELGLDAIDLFAVEEYANALRSNNLGHESLRPVMGNVVVDKLVRQLEISVKESRESKAQLLEIETKLTDSDKKVTQMESALLELSKALVEAGSSSSTEPNLKFPEVKMLLDFLQLKLAGDNPKVIDAIQKLEISKANLDLKKEISRIRLECEELRTKAEMNFAEAAKKSQAIENMERDLLDNSINRKNNASLINTDDFLFSNSFGTSSILEQLIECIEELEESGKLLDHSNSQLQDYAAKFTPLCIKARLLYRDFSSMRKTHEEEILKLKKEVDQIQGSNTDLKHSLKLFEETMESLKLGSNDLQQKYVDCQRKLVVSEVNEKALLRRMAACESSEKTILKENQRLKEDITDIDGIARQTISRLYRHKKEAEQFALEIGERWSESVSLKQYKVLENKLAMYISKTKLLLERERSYVEIQTLNETYRLKSYDLQNQVYSLELKAKEFEMKAAKFDAFLDAAKVSDDYLADKYWRPKFDSLTVQAEILRQRADISEQKVHALQELELSMRNQMNDTERHYIAAKEEIITVKEENLSILNAYEGGANREEYEASTQKSIELEAKVQELSRECEKYQSMAEISAAQCLHLQSTQKNDLKELVIMKAAIKDLQMNEDSKFVIGQLHQRLLTLQKAESTALAEARELKLKSLHLEKIVVELETQNSAQSKMIFDLRIKTKNRIAMLQKILSDLKMRLSGSISIESHGRACENAKRLSELNKTLESQLENIAIANEKLQTQLDAANIKSAMFEELSTSIKDNGSAVQKRIAIWHNRIAESQTNQLKARREAAKEKEKCKSLKSSFDASSKRVEELEDLLNQIQSERDLEVMEWDTQQGLYEKTIASFEEERDRLYLTTTPSELKDTLPDRNLPIGEQLEAALRMLVERTRLMKSAQISHQRLENKYNEKLMDLKKTNELLNTSHLECKKLQHQLQVQELGKNDRQAEENGIDSDKSRVREAKALRFAHETTASLQRQLNQKNEMILKYRTIIQDMQKDLEDKSIQKNELIIDLNKKIDSLTRREIERVQSAVEQKKQDDEAELERDIEMLTEMQQLLHSKEIAFENLAREFEEFKNSISFEKQALIAEKEELASQRQSAQFEKAEAQAMALKAERELSEVKELLNRPGVKDLSDVVSKLQVELSSKQQKNSQMKKAIDALKNQVEALTKELSDAKIANNSGPSPAESLIQQKLANKISQMDLRLKRANETNLKLQEENRELRMDIQRVSAELLAKNTELVNYLNDSDINVISGDLPKSQSLQPPQRQSSSPWEINKAEQKKLEALKDKLKVKTAECQALENSYQLLKSSHAKSEKDRLRLQAKIEKMNSESPANSKTDHAEKVLELESKVIALQTSLSKALKRNKTQPPPEKVVPLPAMASSSSTEELKQEIELLNIKKKEIQAKYIKLDEENQKLRRILRKESEKFHKMEELKIANEALVNEVSGLRKAVVQKDGQKSDSTDNPKIISDLKNAIAEKEKLIQELLSPDANESSRLAGENRRLKRELEMAQIRFAKLTSEQVKGGDTVAKVLVEENERLKSQTRLMEVELKKMQVELEDLSFNYKELVKKSLTA